MSCQTQNHLIALFMSLLKGHHLRSSVFSSALRAEHQRHAFISCGKKNCFISTEKMRLCIRLQGKQLNSLCLHKSKHLGPPPKLISAAAFTDLIGFNQMIGAVGHKMRKHFWAAELFFCIMLNSYSWDILLKCTNSSRLPNRGLSLDHKT